METKDFLLLPCDGHELVTTYFDKDKHAELHRNHERYEQAYQAMVNGYAVKDKSLNKLTISECGHRYSELSKEIYRTALKAFVEKACDEQKETCERQFWISPAGEEGSWISSSPLPCLYMKGQFEKLYGWWENLPHDVVLSLPEKILDFFGEKENTETLADYAFREFNKSPAELNEDDIVLYYCCQWDNIPVADKERIYAAFNPPK